MKKRVNGMVHLYPSLMAVPLTHMSDEIALLQPACAGFHLDIMDNQFVPHFTWDIDTANMIIKKINSVVWIHLMVKNPALFFAQLALPAGSLVSFHIESEVDVISFAKTIKEKNCRVSIAIRPKTDIVAIIPFLHVIDHVLVMSVEPGLSGQPFLESSYEKIDKLIAYKKKYNHDFAIGIDGGIDATNIATIAGKGVDDCAIASAIFKHIDHLRALQQLQSIAEGIKKELE
jgi:ribulose-phosphate 3-epimerase